MPRPFEHHRARGLGAMTALIGGLLTRREWAPVAAREEQGDVLRGTPPLTR